MPSCPLAQDYTLRSQFFKQQLTAVVTRWQMLDVAMAFDALRGNAAWHRLKAFAVQHARHQVLTKGLLGLMDNVQQVRGQGRGCVWGSVLVWLAGCMWCWAVRCKG